MQDADDRVSTVSAADATRDGNAAPAAGSPDPLLTIRRSELRRYAALLRYRTACFATGSACLAFALSMALGAELELGHWGEALPPDFRRMEAHAGSILLAIAAGFYALGALFAGLARRWLATVTLRSGG
jgi:hypothetical protein